MKLTWSISQRKSGRPFDPATEVDHYVLEMQVEGAPDFTPIPAPGATALEYTLDVTDPGTYNFRLTCFPKVGTASDPALGSAQILDQSAPVIATFTVEI